MSIEEKKTYVLSWGTVNDFVSEELFSIMGHVIRCKVAPDDFDFWSIRICDSEMSLLELLHLLEAVRANKEMARESIPNDSNTAKSLGMHISTCLLQRKLGCRWERVIAEDNALWLIGCSMANTLDIGNCRISFDQLKSKDELMNWFAENGTTHTELMDFSEDYRNEYKNELCWQYPISDGKHLGTYFVLVKEGILSLPYDEAVKEYYEVFMPEDARLFRKASDMSNFISDWDDFSNNLRNTMLAMFHYLKELEDGQNI